MASVEASSSSSLDVTSLEKAKRELNEDPETRNDFVLKLKDKILNEEASGDPELEGVVFERKDKGFLLRFLRARKFDQDRALQLYTNYYRVRRDYPQIFSEFTAQSVRDVLQSGAMTVLDHPARDGAKVVCVQPKHVKIENFSAWIILRAMLLVIEKLLEDETTQVHGVRVIINYDEVEFSKVWRFSQMEATKNGVMPKIMQDAMPVRLKGIHLVKQPWYVSIVLTILRSFMKEKMKERFNQHGYDFESLHDAFHPEYLPSDLNGPLPPLDEFSAARLFKFQEPDLSKQEPDLLEQEPVPRQSTGSDCDDDIIDV